MEKESSHARRKVSGYVNPPIYESKAFKQGTYSR